jgi:hypothetical protein
LPAKDSSAEAIIVHGPVDMGVKKKHTDWQESRVSNEALRNNINKARDVTRKLPQSHEDL